jgi:peptidase E
MVEVHKEVLAKTSREAKAFFLDTPAGFQLNADQLSQRAVEYFRSRINHPMKVASFKSASVSRDEAEKVCADLRGADYVLVGPGSPTYAVSQWMKSPVPDILYSMVERGGCLVAASAAALTIGKFTLPVYEIYKVGSELHWAEGMDILGRFGFNHVVIPHWNNAEGGTHDTRFCFMGEERFDALVSLLPEETGIIGLDEHTACIIDLGERNVWIRGIGSVYIRHREGERVLKKGERFPLDVLFKGGGFERRMPATKKAEVDVAPIEEPGTNFWDSVHAIEESFNTSLETDPAAAVTAVLELDGLIWKAKQDLENEEFIAQAREIFRELIVLAGVRLSAGPSGLKSTFSTLVEELISLRESFRRNGQWKDADAVRDCLARAGVVLQDTPGGTQWSIKD